MSAPTRRQILAGTAGLITVAWVSGCSADEPVPRTADEAELDALAAIEQQLDQWCRAAAATQGAPTARLRNAAKAHADHSDALVARGAVLASATATPALSEPPAPRSITEIVDAQVDAATRCTALAEAADPELARLLTAVGGSDAAWAQLLAGAR